MTDKIIEALMNYYEDDEETLVDCLMSLKDDKQVGLLCREALFEIEHCPRCGNKLKISSYKETTGETMLYQYCPGCGKEF